MNQDERGADGLESDADGVLSAGAAGDQGGDFEGFQAASELFPDAVDPFGGEDDGDFPDEGEGGEGSQGVEEERGSGQGDEGLGEAGAEPSPFSGGGQNDPGVRNFHGGHI